MRIIDARHTIFDAYAMASPTLTKSARYKSVVFEKKIQKCSQDQRVQNENE